MSHLSGLPGFTLLEVLLSVAIITILTAISLPVYASFSTRNDLDISAEGIADALRRAQVYTRGVNGDSQWGVEIQSSSATLFKGATFAGRATGFDEIIDIPDTVTASGLGEVMFTKLSGAPSTTGTITLTLNANNIRTITINAKGTVTY